MNNSSKITILAILLLLCLVLLCDFTSADKHHKHRHSAENIVVEDESSGAAPRAAEASLELDPMKQLHEHGTVPDKDAATWHGVEDLVEMAQRPLRTAMRPFRSLRNWWRRPRDAKYGAMTNRWDTAGPMDLAWQEFDRALDSFSDMWNQMFENFGIPDTEQLLRGLHETAARSGTLINVNVDVIEKETEYELHAEVPGLNKENLRVEVVFEDTLYVGGPKQPVLRISGEKVARYETDIPVDRRLAGAGGTQEKAEAPQGRRSEGKVHRVETSYGSFERRFRLPPSVDLEKNITARYENGVLTVKIPKKPLTEKAQPSTTKIINIE
eukprot:GEZU01039896.1.p1 GENE.GEZU01039896.1~~GEZU01039896.1.p1  ORF type:complete len:326 (-),score=65.79 GEZU01039896.1:506-1483(-)